MIKPGEPIIVQFTTQNPFTAEKQDADLLPNGTLVINGLDDILPVVITHITTGVYSASTAAPLTVLDSDKIQIRIAATVAGNDGVAVIWTDRIDTSYIIAFPAGAISFTYVVINQLTSNPEPNVVVWISTDNNDPPTNVIWKGTSDSLGVARDVLGNLPRLDPNTYYFWATKSRMTFAWPDTETVSP